MAKRARAQQELTQGVVLPGASENRSLEPEPQVRRHPSMQVAHHQVGLRDLHASASVRSTTCSVTMELAQASGHDTAQGRALLTVTFCVGFALPLQIASQAFSAGQLPFASLASHHPELCHVCLLQSLHTS